MFVRAVTAVLALAAAPCFAQTISLTGLDGVAHTITAADLGAMPRTTAALKREGGGAAHYAGVALTDLLRRVDAPSDKTLRGAALADIVVVSAADGYRVVLALSDLDPAFCARKAILADRLDSAPLPASEGPFRLVVDGDLRGARSARMVTAITLERAP